MKRKHFVSLSIFQIMAMFRRGIFYFFLSIYLKEYLHVTNTEMTLFATLPMIANIFSQSFIWGRISDKFKKRRLLIVFGESYAAVGYLVVYWIHHNFESGGALRAAAFTIIIGFTIIEAGWSSSNLGWTALIADLTRDSERSKVMGLLQFIGGIGNILGVTASGFLYLDGKGFAEGYLFYISSGIMIFSIIALFLIPESYAELEGSNDKELVELVEEQKSMRTEVKDADGNKISWEWKLFIWILIILAIVNIGGNSINQLLNIYIRLPNTFDASDMVVAQLRNTTNISMIIAGLIVGFLTARFGDDKILLVGFIFAFIGLIVIPFAPHIIFVFIYMALRGFTRVWVQTTSYSMINRLVPLSERGKMMGYYNATFYLSWGLGGTLITGPIADAIVVSNLPIILTYSILGMVFIGLWIFLLFSRVVNFKQHKRIMFILTLLWLGVVSVIVTFLANPLSTSIINMGSSDSYAYKVTFLVAAALVVVGILTYSLYRPRNFNLLVLDKNNSRKKDKSNKTFA
ncbi:MAG: MFS transporter [Candidatus Heimdallarchaeaceae archaeon]